MSKRIAILGSTGSIGTSTLDVVRKWPDRFSVEVLVAGCRWEELRAQIREFRPRVVALADDAAADELARELRGTPNAPELLRGEHAATEAAAAADVDLVISAIVGSRGLGPTLAALRRGTPVAIANKEPLVVAGELVKAAARASGAELLPLDSELSAIHQCLRGNSERTVRRVLLTASGGPFRTKPASEFVNVTPADALGHPTWDMGPKVTVDSATLMNKGLEVMETHHYFDLPYDRIEVVVHPQSLIHSMVEYVDHSVIAQISEPDMCLPIQYAMTWPERLPSPVPPVDFARVGSLDFEEPDLERFPCLRLAQEAGRAGGTAPAVLNAANEVAVEAFLAEEIAFVDIPAVIEECLQTCETGNDPTLENFHAADGFSRREARRLVERRREKSRL